MILLPPPLKLCADRPAYAVTGKELRICTYEASTLQTQLYSQPQNNVLVIVSQIEKPTLMLSTFIFQQKAALEMGQHQDKDMNFSHQGLECFQQNMETNQVEQVM